MLTEIQLVEAVSDLRSYRNDNEKQRLAEAYNDVWQRTGVSGNLRSQLRVVVGPTAAMKAMLRGVVDALKEMESNASAPNRHPQPATSSVAIRRACAVEAMTSGMGCAHVWPISARSKDKRAVVALVFLAARQASRKSSNAGQSSS